MNVQVYFTVIFLVALSSSRLSMVGASPGSLSTAILMRVDQSGKGDYQKIQDAIDAVPSNNTEVVFIWVKPGIYRYFFFSICCLMHISERQAVEVISWACFYREKIVVPADKPFITLSGTKATTTIITWNDTGEIFDSPTFSVLATDFVGRFLTIQVMSHNFFISFSFISLKRQLHGVYQVKYNFIYIYMKEIKIK